MTFAHSNQHSHHPKKHKKQPESRKQVSQVTEDSIVKRKRIRGKTKGVQKKKLTDAPCVKTVVEEHVSYEVAITIPSINKTVSTNYQAD